METLSAYLGEHFWAAQVFAIVLATAFVRYLVKALCDRLAKAFASTHNLYDDALVDALRRPLGMAVWVVGVSFAAEIAGGEDPADIFAYVEQLRVVIVLALLVWFAVRFISFCEAHVADPEYGDGRVDQTTALAIGKLLRVAVIVSGVLMALQYLGIPITGVLAFGGVGGIAIGFAARDLLANFFGALMIFLDRPFAVGDWVRSPDREIEGTVEDIGWRLTRIRTFDKRPLYVPNSVFTSITVENPSRMRNRRIYETVGVRYDDVGAVAAIVDDIKAMLQAHVAIDQGQTLIVNMLQFSESSIDIMIYTFTRTTVWTEFHEIKQDVLLKIADIIAAHGAEIAFPTKTLHVVPEQEPEA